MYHIIMQEPEKPSQFYSKHDFKLTDYLRAAHIHCPDNATQALSRAYSNWEYAVGSRVGVPIDKRECNTSTMFSIAHNLDRQNATHAIEKRNNEHTPCSYITAGHGLIGEAPEVYPKSMKPLAKYPAVDARFTDFKRTHSASRWWAYISQHSPGESFGTLHDHINNLPEFSFAVIIVDNLHLEVLFYQIRKIKRRQPKRTLIITDHKRHSSLGRLNELIVNLPKKYEPDAPFLTRGLRALKFLANNQVHCDQAINHRKLRSDLDATLAEQSSLFG